MFVTGDVYEGSFIAEYSGERITAATAIPRRQEHTVLQDNPDYVLTVDGGNVFIDETDFKCGADS